jgi:CRP-like cAMP-binding protein
MNTSGFFNYPQSDPSDSEQPAEPIVFLTAWSDDQWSKLLEYTQTQLYDPGDVVIQAGSAEYTLYIVAFGTLDVRTKERGRDVRLAVIETGSVIGEQAFFDGKPRSASVVATSACQVLQLSRDRFEMFAARHPLLAREFLFDLGRVLSLRFRATVSVQGGS